MCVPLELDQAAFSSAGGMAKAGPMPMSLGSTPTSEIETNSFRSKNGNDMKQIENSSGCRGKRGQDGILYSPNTSPKKGLKHQRAVIGHTP